MTNGSMSPICAHTGQSLNGVMDQCVQESTPLYLATQDCRLFGSKPMVVLRLSRHCRLIYTIRFSPIMLSLIVRAIGGEQLVCVSLIVLWLTIIGVTHI